MSQEIDHGLVATTDDKAFDCRPGLETTEPTPERVSVARRPRELSKKAIALMIVAILITVSVVVIWFAFFSARSTEDIASYIIPDPTDASPGFKHSLAGDTVRVKGEVTRIETYASTLGNMSFVTLDGYADIRLVVWDEVPYEVGDNIRTEVEFEWAVCNDERHVYSPQLDFPMFAYLPSVAAVVTAVGAVAGTVMKLVADSTDAVVLEVFDQNPEFPLSELNCSLRVGSHSFAGEYVDAMGLGVPENPYGHEMGTLSNLTEWAPHDANITFVDVDDDDQLSRHDRFELRNLTRPEQRSGAYTYVLILGIGESLNFTGLNTHSMTMAYMVMTSRGILRMSGETPYMRTTGEVSSNTEAKFLFERVYTPVAWDDVNLTFQAGDYWGGWNVSKEGLDSGSPSQIDLPTTSINGSLLRCRIVDLSGNGVINEGDYFVISVLGGTAFSASTAYGVSVIYEPTNEAMARYEFRGI